MEYLALGIAVFLGGIVCGFAGFAFSAVAGAILLHFFEPLLAIPLVLGLLVAFGALLWRVTGIAFGAPQGRMEPVKASYLPMFAHLALVLGAGLYLPPALVAWFQHVADLLG